MSDLISRQGAIDALGGNEPVGDPSKMDDDDVVKMWERIRIINIINKLPSVQPERKKDIIQKFHDYQIDWLKSHYDIELEPQLEEMIVRFLHDTANCYMMEIDREEGEQE